MSKNNSKLIYNSIILFLGTATIFLLVKLDKRASGDVKTSTTINVLGKKVIKTSETVRSFTDTVTKILHELKHDSTTITKHDTADIYSRYEIYKLKTIQVQNGLQDSVNRLIRVRNELMTQIGALKIIKKNIVFQELPKSITQKSVIDSNADIVVYPFKKQFRHNVFSPQLNYMRVFNKYPGGTINNLPYFDYQQTNDEINLLLFQARTSYNFTTNTFSYGPGIELKINRVSLNVATLFNTNNDPFKHPTLSFGTKLDVYRIRFK